ncbi:hypothetical protein PROFUN_09691, partial [Planoprotostelium fungivorum]
PIPRNPPLFTGYHHVASAVFYNENNTEHTICKGDSENGTCNPFTLLFSIDDHTHYLGVDVGQYCESFEIPKDAKFVKDSPNVCPKRYWRMWMIAPIIGGVIVLGLVVAAIIHRNGEASDGGAGMGGGTEDAIRPIFENIETKTLQRKSR